ncbi:MAG: 3,4-dihydroxy-2-butanone-4-phosphate synthase, partial [Flavobacteriales bacterium]
RPGHIFPLKAKNGGVLRRTGHTEAAVDLARLAGLAPAGAIVEIMNDDGSMARLPQLIKIADQFGLKLISIRDLIAYRLSQETLVEEVATQNISTGYGDFRLVGFRQTIEQKEYLALVKGDWNEEESIPVRVHSSNMLGDIFNLQKDVHGSTLDAALRLIEKEGKGVLVYINRMDTQGGLLQQMNSIISMFDSGPGAMDNRDYGIGAQILRQVGVKKMRIITNHPEHRRAGLDAYGLEITGTIPLHD